MANLDQNVGQKQNQGQKEFTQEELQQAFSQMQCERGQEGRRAQAVAEWLSSKLNGATVWARGEVSALHSEYELHVVHETYGLFVKDLIVLLEGIPEARVYASGQDEEWVKGVENVGVSEVCFEVDVSGVSELSGLGEVRFWGRFEYFDNHVGGW